MCKSVMIESLFLDKINDQSDLRKVFDCDHGYLCAIQQKLSEGRSNLGDLKRVISQV